MSLDDDTIFRRRSWLLNNIDWLMSEVTFHKSCEDFLKNDSVVLWKFDSGESGARIE